ncbi:asparagine synthase-related protein [Halorubrum sp. CSM-61]|uniref:asparagine synthase-related protein n=1 Tax=Halorubrum sp. CSM-61 TaxID=2485838 RepID=UPI000F4C8485|nr:asparagine synthase-related protein [Halorubrum sp. CSM-61]
MPGILGGNVDEVGVNAVAEPMRHEQWYEFDRVQTGRFELGVVHHGDRDPASDLFWEGDDAAGVLHGVVTDAPVEEGSPERLFRRLLDEPAETLSAMDGLFSVACADEETFVLATDKNGSRPCYYAREGDMRFSSELKSLVPVLESPSVDLRALSDLLTFGYVLGSTTLLTEVAELRPAHVLTVSDGDRSIEQYWEPGFELTPVANYSDQVDRAYSRSVDSVVDTIDTRTGLWLSGGLDSRILAGKLTDADHPFRAMTYGPTDSDEFDAAEQVTATLGVDHDQITLGPPSAFAAHLDRAIGLTDGMISWTYLLNFVHILNELADVVDVTLEAAPQDTYMGHDLSDADARKLESESVADRLFQRYGKLDPDQSRMLLNDSIDDPLAPLRDEADVTSAETPENVYRSVVWNVLAYSHFRSSGVMRSQVGTRVPAVSSDFLETAAKRPAEYNQRSVPFTDGAVPMATTRIKFDLVRQMDESMAQIPYQLSGLPASYPQWAHTIGMGLRESLKRVQTGQPGWTAVIGHWYRTDPALNSRLNELLDAASERPEFNAAAIRALQQEHLSGQENNIDAIAAITTSESWRQQYLD